MVDNLRRSMLDPSILLLLLGGWFELPGIPGYWTAVGIAVLLLPVYCDFLFALLRTPRGWRAPAAWARQPRGAPAHRHTTPLISLLFLLSYAIASPCAKEPPRSRVHAARAR